MGLRLGSKLPVTLWHTAGSIGTGCAVGSIRRDILLALGVTRRDHVTGATGPGPVRNLARNPLGLWHFVFIRLAGTFDSTAGCSIEYTASCSRGGSI